jgi:GNAT superfamily N-acetyltransferase
MTPHARRSTVPSIDVRPFQRRDREQLTALVNAHIEAVLPGVAVSVNAVLSQLEREPGETIVDPWAVDRATFVAVVRDAVVGAAHLVRYGTGERVSDSYRDTAEIRWLVFAPGEDAAADVLVARIEAVLVADVAALPRGGPPPLEGLTVRRGLGGHATRFSAVLGGRVAGFFEVQADLTAGGALSRLAGWADVWELHVEEDVRRRGIATWLIGHGADWLRLARAERLIDYAIVGEGDAHLAFATALGFRELTRATRGWSRPVSAAP